MKKSILVFFALLTIAISLLAGCMPSKSMVTHKRDNDFYKRLVNSSLDEDRAADKMNDLKILQTGSEYPIRTVLFDSGKFYYQVDKLGDGYGSWIYKDGVLELEAKRPLFNMEFTVSAAAEKGDAMVVQFVDRFGFNTYALSIREPAPSQKHKAGSVLSTFTKSPKDI